jgi:hypothetical protein
MFLIIFREHATRTDSLVHLLEFWLLCCRLLEEEGFLLHFWLMYGSQVWVFYCGCSRIFLHCLCQKLCLDFLAAPLGWDARKVWQLAAKDCSFLKVLLLGFVSHTFRFS